MDKKLLILTCFFSMLTLISSIICSSLVFYNEQTRTELNSNQVLATSHNYINTSIVYNHNNTISLSGLNPGYNITQTFSITNNNSNAIKYNIEWSDVVTTWNSENNGLQPKPEEFVYNLVCSNGEKIENKRMPLTESDFVILKNLELKTNKSNDCTIKITFINTGADQSYNLNKAFKGTYKAIVQK